VGDLSKSWNFSKILVAIDGSEPSMAAADYAISVAQKDGSELIALYVIQSGTSILGPTPPPHLIEIKNEAQQYLDKIKQKSSESDDGIKLKTEIIASPSIVDGIVSFAEKENVGLIIVGTKGRSAIKKLLLGSVSSGVVTYAHCTVTVVR
jgi:nucleotide-binding universal stress UspA family protein